MPDLVSGTRIKAADYPPAVTKFDGTDIVVSSTTYIVVEPVVDVIFVAPTSGRVLLAVSLAGQDSGSSSDFRVLLAPQVFEGSDETGVEIVAPAASIRGVMSCNTAFRPAMWSRVTLLEGLTPETTYYARLMHRVDGGTTPESDARDLSVIPVP